MYLLKTAPTETENKMLKDNLYNLAKDPKNTYLPPTAKDQVPYLNFSELDNSLVQLRNLAEGYQKVYNTGTQLPVEKQNQLNQVLFNAERSLISEGGLPRRPWYKHEIYAPGFYTGYGVKTLPAIREAIEQRNWKEAQEQIVIDAKAITKLSDYLMKAALK